VYLNVLLPLGAAALLVGFSAALGITDPPPQADSNAAATLTLKAQRPNSNALISSLLEDAV
jgi:hypothetical protein